MDELQEILKLQKESCERDTKMETTLEFMEKRMDGFELVLKEMSEVLSEQKHLSTVVDQLAVAVTNVSNRVTTLEDSMKEIKHLPAKNFYETFKKIVWIAVPILVGAVCTFLGVSIKNALANIGG